MILPAILAGALLLSACFASPPPATFRVASWDEAGQAFFAACDAPGGVLLVDNPAGRFLQAYGVASLEDARPLQVDDRFEIGSNTKSFTAVLALQLQEEDIWSLDDPLRQWLPDEAIRVANGDSVTLRQLASNTSGIWDYANPLIGAAIEDGTLEQGYTPHALIDYVVANGKPSFAPGEGAEYSSTNFVLLGMAIEAATGQALAQLYQERIFAPLGLADSFLLAGVPEEDAVVDGFYARDGAQLLETTAWNGSQGWAAGGIISTAADLAAYAAGLASGSLFQDATSLIEMTDFGSEPVFPFLGYGLGVGKYADSPIVWGHEGQTPGFQTLFAIYAENQTIVVLLTNSASCRVNDFLRYVQASPHLLPETTGTLMNKPSFPLTEPDYANKRLRSFASFADALALLTPADVVALDALILGKTIPELQTLMDTNQLTAAELVIYYVHRIQQYDIDRLNAVMELNPDALEIARARDGERAAGTIRGPLHGIPVLLKDNIATGDQLHTTAGAFALRNWQADRDAFLVQQLREAGAIILGKANLSEWANYIDPGLPNGFSTLGGQTRHPYGPFDPLGSSSGSAVTVAANLVTVSVGTETQGSIIMPAASSGIVGLKTSLGLVSRDHIIPLVDWMDVPGPMGRTVTDVAILLTAMAGVDERDPATADAAELAGVDFTQYATAGAAGGKRVGLFVTAESTVEALIRKYELEGTAAQEQRRLFADADARTRAAGALLADLGLEVVEISSEEMPATPSPFQVLEYGFQDSLNRFLAQLGDAAPVASLAEVAAINAEDPQNRVPFGQGYITGSVNTTITADEYAALARENEATAVAGLRHVFDTYQVDAIVVGFSQAYAAAGYPAISIPSGLNERGQPVGMTFIGDFLGEPDLIAIAYAVEQAKQGRSEPELATTLTAIDALSTPASGAEETMLLLATDEAHVASVAALEAAYGPPSQTAFGSAVFTQELEPTADLAEAAQAWYRHFVGDLWTTYGAETWLGPWREVYIRPATAEHAIVNELRAIDDREAALAVPMLLDNNPAALAAVFDDPTMAEVRAFTLGDGAAMTGLLLAGRQDTGQAVFLLFLMD